MKIYTIYNNKLHSAEVIKKPKTYILKNPKDKRVFDYKTHFRQDEVCLTPEDAIEKAFSEAVRIVQYYEKYLKEAQQHLKDISELRKKCCVSYTLKYDL